MAPGTCGVLPVQLELVTHRLRRRLLTFVAVLQSRHVWRWRRRRRVEECRQHVCAAEDGGRPRSQGRERQDTAVAEQPEPVRIRLLHLPEALAVDAWNSVMLRQP